MCICVFTQVKCTQLQLTSLVLLDWKLGFSHSALYIHRILYGRRFTQKLKNRSCRGIITVLDSELMSVIAR